MDCKQLKNFAFKSKRSSIDLYQHLMDCDFCLKLVNTRHYQELEKKVKPGQKLVDGKIWEETRVWYLETDNSVICVHPDQKKAEACFLASYLSYQVQAILSLPELNNFNDAKFSEIASIFWSINDSEDDSTFFRLTAKKLLRSLDWKHYLFKKKIYSSWHQLMIGLNGGDLYDGDGGFDFDDTNSFASCPLRNLRRYRGFKGTDLITYLEGKLNTLSKLAPNQEITAKFLSLKTELNMPLKKHLLRLPTKSSNA